jgi:hypothetical protein
MRVLGKVAQVIEYAALDRFGDGRGRAAPVLEADIGASPQHEHDIGIDAMDVRHAAHFGYTRRVAHGIGTHARLPSSQVQNAMSQTTLTSANDSGQFIRPPQ